MDHFSLRWKTLLSVCRWLAVVVTPVTGYIASNGNLFSLLYIPLLVVCNTAFAVTVGAFSLLTLLVFMGEGFDHLYLAQLSVVAAVTLGFGAARTLVRFDTAGGAEHGFRSWLTRKSLPCFIALAGALMLLTLFRPFSYWASLEWAVIYGVLGLSISREDPRAKFKVKSALTSAVLLAVSIAVSLAILEAGLRMVMGAPQGRSGVYIPDKDYIFTLRPDYSKMHHYTVAHDLVLSNKVTISSQGLRDRYYGSKEPDEFRILMLGDSFTMGHALEVQNSIPKRLEALLSKERLSKRVSVINAGVGSYGPWQELGRLLNVGIPLEADLVILQLFTNDIDDGLVQYDKHLRAYNRRSRHRAALLQFHTRWQVRCELWLRTYSKTYELTSNWRRGKSPVLDLLNSIRFIRPAKMAKLAPPEARTVFIEVQLNEWYPELEEGWRIFERDVLKIYETAREQGMDFLAYCVPEKSGLLDRRWEETTLGRPELYEQGKDVRMMEDFFAREEIPWVSVRDALYEASKTKPMYYPEDGHLNSDGANLTAQILAKHLLEQKFPSMRPTAQDTRQNLRKNPPIVLTNKQNSLKVKP